MAALTCDFFSEALEAGTSVSVVLPQPTRAQIGVSSSGPGGPPPVLYLLHGLSDDHTAWTRYTCIERYAAAAGLAVVMPAVGRSFYADERHALFARVFGDHPAPEEDLFELLGRRRGERLPALHVSCGTGDALLGGAQRFAAAALEAGADVTTDYRPGDHEWGLWDAVVRDVIDWLPRRTSPA